jgi:UDP-N-acetylglucosamine transferase subunit ALG13
VPVKYLGPLSRLENIPAEIKYDLAIILSGPEPQRTIFEEILLKDLENNNRRVLLVRGLPENKIILKTISSSLDIYNHLPATELNRAIMQSEIIISRCGYTTVMDLVSLQKKAILVPTPGQPEQEYLADYLLKQDLLLCVKQKSFSLSMALKNAEYFSFKKITFPQTDYEKVIENFVQPFYKPDKQY